MPTTPRPDLLAPPPRRVRLGDGYVAPWRAARGVRVAASVENAPAVRALLADLGQPASAGAAGAPHANHSAPARESVSLWLHEEPTVDLPPQGYRLRVGAGGIDAVAPDRAGLLHAVATLRQWLRLHPRRAPAPGESPAPLDAIRSIEIEDWPDFADRGVMLDVSRDQVPTLATLERLIDLLASWKINQLQLYTEHTFAYAGHEEVWRGSSPLTPADVRTIDGWCAERGIDLVPNQNSFGHLHRWLVHHPYRRLAECPEGIEHPWSGGRLEPFSLCPIDPGSLALLDDLYEQLLPCFRSRLFNVGLDETFDLGRCRSKEACATRGRGRVYLDFLRAIHARVAAWGRRTLFWGDIALEHPELLVELPGDALPMLWGYEADHPFAAQAGVLAATGLEFYLCPGTSSWLSFAGRWSNALANLAGAAATGAEHGARGLLITDWGDRGHLQPLAASLPPLLAGACFAWSASAARSPEALPVAELLDQWVDGGSGLGQAMIELADVHQHTGRLLKNSTVPFHLLVGAADPLTRRGLDRLDPGALAATAERAASCVAAIDRGPARQSGDERPMARARDEESPEGALLRDELAWAGEAIGLGCDLGRARLEQGAIDAATQLDAATRRALARRLDRLIEARRELWLRRSRPGGLADALGHLRRVRDLLDGTIEPAPREQD